tara:strand:+ start:240 stop:413 length:174 start_codon:yes stop_codon:yes gene_type:complete
MRDIEPEELAQRIVDMLDNADCRRYVLEDLTEYYSDLKFDSPGEYEDDLRKYYSDDI